MENKKQGIRFSNQWQKIPKVLLDKLRGREISLRGIYVYSKLLMLPNSLYCREAWVSNALTRKREMSVDAFSDITKDLVSCGLISKHIIKEEGKDYGTNEYIINDDWSYYSGSENYFSPVMNNFINSSISASGKGFGIALSLLSDIPKSDNGISKALNISRQTVKKYREELEEVGILLDYKLDEELFPPLSRRSAFKKLLETDWGSERIAKQLKWIDELNIDYKQKMMIFHRLEMGFWGGSVVSKDKEDLEDIVL